MLSQVLIFNRLSRPEGWKIHLDFYGACLVIVPRTSRLVARSHTHWSTEPPLTITWYTLFSSSSHVRRWRLQIFCSSVLRVVMRHSLLSSKWCTLLRFWRWCPISSLHVVTGLYEFGRVGLGLCTSVWIFSDILHIFPLLVSLPFIYDNWSIFSSSLWFYISIFCDYLIGSTHPNLIRWYSVGFTIQSSSALSEVNNRQIIIRFFVNRLAQETLACYWLIPLNSGSPD